MYILAIETSCDDTSVAVSDTEYNILAEMNASQLVHNEYGGVVPEIASRIHIQTIMKLTDAVLKRAGITFPQIEAVAVSVNPGLIGSLLVGVSYAKALSYSIGKPLIAVNHLLGHIYVNKITYPDLSPPFLALVVSGGHTELVYFRSHLSFNVVGRTCDDAAGEAFDKIAKILGLGYPGGPVIDSLSKQGNADFTDFPQAFRQKRDYNFSYSGLKTAVLNYVQSHEKDYIRQNINHIAASAQKAIVSPLVRKTIQYALELSNKQTEKKLQTDADTTQEKVKIVLAGGVAANSLLRQKMIEETEKYGFEIYIPPVKHCMDNASMIAAAAIVKYENKDFASLDLNPFSTKGIREIR